MIGFGLQAVPQNHQLYVTGLYSPSPAEQQGIDLGDRILTINGEDLTYISDERFCEFVLSPVSDRYSNSLTLTIQRHQEQLSFSLESNHAHLR